jgi:mannose-6-phosphate isomerase-like protein (cupin superfamily)
MELHSVTATEGGIVVGPGEGKLLLKDRWWLPLGAADTPGGLAIMEAFLPPGARATRIHVHHNTDEVWYILDGRLTFRIGSQQLEAGRGTCVAVPRGVVHGLVNTTSEPVRYLLMLTPGKMAGYFEELGALLTADASGPPDVEKWAAIATKYDTEFLNLPHW